MRDVALLTRDVPASPEAYEYYLRANELAYNFDPAARDLYLRCVRQDPKYAPAWARLGRGYRIVAKFGGDPDDFGRAEDALKRALVLNPDLALAHHQLAYLEADSGRAGPAMLRLLERTRAGSHDPDLFAGLVHVCRYNGLLEASLKAAERASSLDPNVRTSVCHTYFMRGQYQKALETSNEVLGFLGPIALLALGRKEEARSLGREMERIGTPLPLVRCAFTWARALADGTRDEAIGVLEQAIPLMTHGPEELYYGARSFAWLSEPDRALAVLSRAVDEGFFCYPALARDPWLDGLRDSSEFARILQRAQECHSAAVRAYVQAGGDRILGTPHGRA
jgi:tetratricopeptide (TPR) repeat protein